MKYISMNSEMAKAIFNNHKTQTSRAITKFYDISLENPKKYPIFFENVPKDLEFEALQGFGNPCPLFYSKSEDKFYCGKEIKYKTGGKIWVREPAIVTNYISRYNSTKIDYQLKSNDKKEYRIDLPSRFFPNPKKWITNCQSVPNGCIKEMAKTFVVNMGTRVEKLQDITFEDILSEGYDNNYFIKYLKRTNRQSIKAKDFVGINEINAFEWFKNLWNKTAPKGYKWEDNPFVYVYNFKKINYD